MTLASPTAFELNFIAGVREFITPHDADETDEQYFSTAGSTGNQRILRAIMQAVGEVRHSVDTVDDYLTVIAGSGLTAVVDPPDITVYSSVVLRAAIICLNNLMGYINKANFNVKLPALEFDQSDRLMEIRKEIERLESMYKSGVQAFRYDLQTGWRVNVGDTEPEHIT